MSESDKRVPQIYLVIELAQSRKNEDGSMSPAEIETIRSNIPSRYLDIRVVSPIDDVDEDGIYTGSTTSYVEGDDKYEYLAKYPFQVFDAHEGQLLTREPGKEHEWIIHYQENDVSDYCLVLGTPDVSVAIQRFKQTHPTGHVWSVTQAELDQGDDHPQAYLDEFDEILVVGSSDIHALKKPDGLPN